MWFVFNQELIRQERAFTGHQFARMGESASFHLPEYSVNKNLTRIW